MKSSAPTREGGGPSEAEARPGHGGVAPPPTDADDLPRGTMVGRYVLLEAIGRGGMGIVYAAYDTQLNRKLALKFLRPDLAVASASVEIERRMLREAQAMARLTHPNVVAVHDVGTFEHRVFLAMDYVDGTTLNQWLRGDHSLSARLDVLRAAGCGLAAAHEAGLVHRDFKPDNVLVGKDGRVLVTDFGLARGESDGTTVPPEIPLSSLVSPVDDDTTTGASAATFDAPLTQAGRVLGTLGYIAPEQLLHQPATATTDQFSFAVTAYHVLYGERPFRDDTVRRYLLAVRRPIAEPKSGGRVPPWIRRVLLRGLARNPAERYPSLRALLEALDHDPGARRRTWIVRGMGFAAALLGGLTLAIVSQRRPSVCAADPAVIGADWNLATAEVVKSSFAATGVFGGREAATRVIGKMNEFAAAWTAMRRDVCAATYVETRQPVEVYRLKMDCLAREQTELRAIASVLRTADREVVGKATEIAYGLPDVAWCADELALRGSAGLPDDPVKRAKVLSVREQLAEVTALHLGGKFLEASRGAASLVETARAVDHTPTTAETLLASGRVQRSLGEFGLAAALLREAAWSALASGANATAVQAASAEAFVVGAKLRRGGEAELWLDAAHTALRLMGPGASERIALDVLEAEAALPAEGGRRPERAVALTEKLVATYRRLLGVHPKTANALYSLGIAHDIAGEFKEARPLFEQSLLMFQTLTGGSSLDTGIGMYALAFSQIQQGEFDPGEAMLNSAVSILEQNQNSFWTAWTLTELVEVRLFRGDTKGALLHAERALALSEKSNTPALTIEVSVPAADALTLSGRAAEALPICERAVLAQEHGGDVDPEKVYPRDALRCAGDALVALGRAADAVPLLERSLTLTRRMLPADHARAKFSLARALAALHRSRERSIALAKGAHEEFAIYPHLTLELFAVESFLRREGA